MSDKPMTIVEHLDELRRRILISIVVVLLAACFAFWKRQEILAYLMIKPVEHLVFFSPTEAFMEYLKLSFVVGLLLASPVVLFQVWAFASAGMTIREKRAILFAIPFSATLFLGGAAFAFYLVLPWALKFLMEFAGPDILPVFSIQKYLSFVLLLLIMFGTVFELPVAIMLLSKLGLVSPGFLRKNRKIAIVIIFIAAAILTPTPDAFTQVLMAVPLLLLYEISILICRLTYTKEKVI